MRRVRVVLMVVLAVAVVYNAWIFYSRWSAQRAAQEHQTQRERENAREVVNAYGGDRVKILSITVSPPVVSKGEHATLCYGVSNARTVKIEPAPDEEIWPSMSRCVQVTVRKDTTFRLTAQDAQGNMESAVVPLIVK